MCKKQDARASQPFAVAAGQTLKLLTMTIKISVKLTNQPNH